MDDGTEQPPVQRERNGRHAWVRTVALVGGGLVAGGILAGTVTASAATGEETGAGSSTTQESAAGDCPEGGPGQGRGPGGPRGGEEELTGETATAVTDAVLAEYPDADVRRVATDSDGVYEAHIVTAGDEHLVVELDEAFAITGTESHGDGPDRHRDRDRDGSGPADEDGSSSTGSDETEPGE